MYVCIHCQIICSFLLLYLHALPLTVLPSCVFPSCVFPSSIQWPLWAAVFQRRSYMPRSTMTSPLTYFCWPQVQQWPVHWPTSVDHRIHNDPSIDLLLLTPGSTTTRPLTYFCWPLTSAVSDWIWPERTPSYLWSMTGTQWKTFRPVAVHFRMCLLFRLSLTWSNAVRVVIPRKSPQKN